jgi:hypothetical protein
VGVRRGRTCRSSSCVPTMSLSSNWPRSARGSGGRHPGVWAPRSRRLGERLRRERAGRNGGWAALGFRHWASVTCWATQRLRDGPGNAGQAAHAGCQGRARLGLGAGGGLRGQSGRAAQEGKRGARWVSWGIGLLSLLFYFFLFYLKLGLV